ncbi:hypothetical protein MD484_g2689, partial [Candolleomyces efflorescens]
MPAPAETRVGHAAQVGNVTQHEEQGTMSVCFEFEPQPVHSSPPTQPTFINI